MSYPILHQRACQVLFGEVERFCKHHPRHKKRAGRPADYSDSLILKLVLLAYLSGLKGETAILRHAERHYWMYLGRLPSQSRLWVRWRSAAFQSQWPSPRWGSPDTDIPGSVRDQRRHIRKPQ